MSKKPTYEKPEQRIQELEAEVLSIKESEKALKKSHRNFQALLNNSSDYILISDDEGFPVTFNVSYAQEIYSALGIEMKPGPAHSSFVGSYHVGEITASPPAKGAPADTGNPE